MRRVTVPLLCLLLAACASHSPETVAPPPAQRTAFTVERDRAYGPPGDAARVADLYRPEGAGPFPGVVLVHGGGWDARDRSDMTSVARKLAGRGYVVANIDYRLAPAALYPAALEDVRSAVKWLRAEAPRLRLHPDRLAGWGYSAGAHLVALAATENGDLLARLQAVVAGGTPADLPQYPNSPIIRRFIGGSFAEREEVWRQASPLTHVSSDDPPMFLYHGTWDRLVYVEDTLALKQALDRAGVPSELYLLQGAGHISAFLLGGGAEDAAIDFLDRHLRSP